MNKWTENNIADMCHFILVSGLTGVDAGRRFGISGGRALEILARGVRAMRKQEPFPSEVEAAMLSLPALRTYSQFWRERIERFRP